MSSHTSINGNNRRRVVVTGVGAVTPVAQSAEGTWQRMLAGESGVSLIERHDVSDLPVWIAAEIKDTPELPWVDRKTLRTLSRYSFFGIAAAGEAITDAGLSNGAYVPESAGVIMGTGGGGFYEITETSRAFDERGYRRVSPYFMISFPNNMCSYHIAQTFQMVGPNSTVSTACATGAQAIADATAYIRRGQADVMLAGGTEHTVFPLFIASFVAQRAASTRNDEPEKASRPFDAERTGFVIGEGAGALVLESLDHALTRNATIYAEILGAGSTNDGFHAIAPEPDGRGAARAVKMALAEAGIDPSEIDYVNAHAASTPLGDAAETKAIKLALGEEHARRIPVNAPKSMLGHSMGAAGAIETVVTLLSIRDGKVHPTINRDTPDPECDLDYVPHEARNVEIRIALKNSFGLGGQNACLVIGRYNE